MAQPYKICPQCQQPADLAAPICIRCGRLYHTQFVPLPGQTQMFVPPQAYLQTPAFVSSPLTDMQWADLARRYRSAKSAFTITLIIGFIFLWPLWIIAYLEHNKMNDVKREVAAAGVDAETWARSIR